MKYLLRRLDGQNVNHQIDIKLRYDLFTNKIPLTKEQPINFDFSNNLVIFIHIFFSTKEDQYSVNMVTAIKPS